MADSPTRIRVPTRIDYVHTASGPLTAFLMALGERRLVGVRCSACDMVYLPPRGNCPRCFVAMAERVMVADSGTVTTFCIVNVPFEGQVLAPPYACAHILLDGADLPLFHVVGGCAPGAVRMGLRVKARWAEDPTGIHSLEAIRWFEPTGEPDRVIE